MLHARGEGGSRPMTTCFVIGPIGDRFAKPGSQIRRVHDDALRLFTRAIVPACEAVGLDSPFRIDMLSEPGEIPEAIFRSLRDADVVIADLSGANPNVMYELGLRHTLNKVTVTLTARSDSPQPFDVHVIRTIFFQRSSAGYVDARERQAASLKMGIAGKFSPVTATRVWLEALDMVSAVGEAIPSGGTEEPSGGEPDDDPTQVPDSSDLGEHDGPGFLDRIAQAEAAFEGLLRTIGGMSGAMAQVNDATESANSEIAESDRRGAGSAGRIVVAGRLAAKLAAPTAELETLARAYPELLYSVDRGVIALIDAIEADPAVVNRPEVQSFINATVEFASVANTNATALTAWADTVEGVGDLTRVLRPTMRRLAAQARAVARAQRVADEWARRLRPLATAAN